MELLAPAVHQGRMEQVVHQDLQEVVVRLEQVEQVVAQEQVVVQAALEPRDHRDRAEVLGRQGRLVQVALQAVRELQGLVV